MALRKLRRERGYVLLNITSLSLGIASCLLLGLFLRSELTHDRHHHNFERIYRLTPHIVNASGESQKSAAAGPGLGPMITKQFPQLGTYVRFQPAWDITMRVGENERLWNTVYFVDSAVLDVFTHETVYGDPNDALVDPSTIAVSESFARVYFGDANPIGQTVIAENGMSFKVAFVFEDLPDNTHLRYDMLASTELLDQIMPGYSATYAQTLWHPYVHTYLMVPANFDPKSFEAITSAFVATHVGDRARSEKTHVSIVPQRLDRIHFGARLDMDQPTGNILYVIGAAAVASFILIIASINYVNLATARAMSRSKEVGMRKVLGASRSQLVVQLLSESAVLTGIALALAIAAVWLLLLTTPLGALMGKERLIAQLAEPTVILSILGFGVLIALGSGLYPALYLAATSTMVAFRQSRRSWRNGLSLRTVLVFVQLAISIGVIAATLSMGAQLRYIHDKPLGFAKENRLVLTVRGYDVVKQTAAIRTELRRQPAVADVTTISSVPGTGAWNPNRLTEIESDFATMELVTVDRISVGVNFVEAMNLQLLAGRDFDENLERDVEEAVLVNESLVRRMGWRQPIGKRVEVGSYRGERSAHVVGVVRDFHYASLRQAVAPMVFTVISDVPSPPAPGDEGVYVQSFIVAFSRAPTPAILDDLERTVRKFDRQFNLDAVFLEDVIRDVYKLESDSMKLIGLFGSVCLVLSIIGIFGLAAYTTEHRTKEIGIRKVLGASDSRIVTMLGQPMLWLVLAAAVPACLVCYRAIEAWLQRFAYRADIGPSTFIAATSLIGAIALVTVVLQSLRAARADPIDAIRHQ